MNPVLWIELTSRLRERKLWIVCALFVACLTAITGFSILSFFPRMSYANLEPASLGQGLDYALSYFLMGLLLILGPLAGAAAITLEREQRTIAGLLNTPISRFQIAWGKMASTWIFVIWISSLSLPFFATIALWGGMPTIRLLEVFGIAVLAGLTTGALSVGLSGYFARTLSSYLATGASLFFWLAAWPLIGLSMETYVQRSKGHDNVPTVIHYLFYYHNPFVAMADVFTGNAVGRYVLPFALGVWGLIFLFSFALALRGLKRGLFDRL